VAEKPEMSLSMVYYGSITYLLGTKKRPRADTFDTAMKTDS